ncbi:MAG: U32 family peptidase, partial [Bacillota bacterium]|nr:U32 family peptidase [Bacillota bacterium]
MSDQSANQMPMTTLPELLAPAGDFAALQAAIRHGADAVYLGASAFSARRQAANFTGSQLTDAIDLAHLHGLRVYLALNTLIQDSELDQALSVAGSAASAGVDAIILQDTGLAVLLHEWLPDLPLHASTQMTITDTAGLHMAARLGFSRVILARELTLTEVKQLTQQARLLGLETEVFIHGALCMSLSGQCLLSSLNGGRSGNRGACAQPCRLTWTLGKPEDELTDPPFPWLSPCDQSLLDSIAELATDGVAALKIEGRMRQPAYVSQVVSVYRQALDRISRGEILTESERVEAHKRLLIAFNRGGRFSNRPLNGHMGREFLAGLYSGSHGILIGTVDQSDTRSGFLTIRSVSDPNRRIEPSRGDILSVRSPGEDKETASAPIGTIETAKTGWMVRGFHPDVMGKIRAGQSVFLMSSRQAEAAADQSSGSRTNLDLELAGTDHKIRLTARINRGPAAGLAVTVVAEPEPIEPLLPERVRKQLMKTGGTPFVINRIDNLTALCLSIGSLNSLRRHLLDQVAAAIKERLSRQLPPMPDMPCQAQPVQANASPDFTAGKTNPKPNHISAWFYRLPPEPDQLPCGADQYLLPILSLSAKTAGDWTAAIRMKEPDARILAWIPSSRYGRLSRLLPGLLAGLSEWGFDGICAGQSASDLAACLPESNRHLVNDWIWTVDTTANVYNRCSLMTWLKTGAVSVCPSIELGEDALVSLLRSLPVGTADIKQTTDTTQPGPVIEIPVYGHLRVMSNAFCPVGSNEPGCRLCQRSTNDPPDTDPGQTWLLKD